MYKMWAAASVATLFAVSAFGGTLVLEAGDPAGNPEAMSRNAVVVARTTACTSPEKTAVTAAAEGWSHGKRESIPLKIIPLSTPGVYAVQHEWPPEGTWIVTMVATNPDYKDRVSAVVVPMRDDRFSREGTKQFSHVPSGDELESLLKEAARK